ncbi:hypothetical protein [Oceanibium sediminis]|uniref:hypothetical protein n=1 Tax=Oceanibium sediminis TaxID=2026339 RepID=UPI000DD3FF31|nr:hypothetical protein [Oceanibium sediminis]
MKKVSGSSGRAALPHFGIGLVILFGALVWPTYARRRTWYTLTDRRAFIARDLPFRGRTLKTYPITADSPIEHQPGTPGTVTFAVKRKRTAKGAKTRKIGFERVQDAEKVYRLLLAQTRGQTT